jgi:hypothetical protein
MPWLKLSLEQHPMHPLFQDLDLTFPWLGQPPTPELAE